MQGRGFLATVPLLAFVCAFVGGPGAAAADDFDRPGFYLGVTGLYGIDFFEDEIEDVLGVSGVEVDGSPGLNAYAGLRLFSWLAVEANYEWMAEFETRAFGGSFQLTNHNLSANVKLFLPIWRVQPYLNLGIGGQYYDLGSNLGVSDTGWALLGRPGVGVDVYVTKHWVLNAQLNGMLSTNDVDAIGQEFNDLFYMSVGAGLQYRF